MRRLLLLLALLVPFLPTPASAATRPTKVLVVVLENHSASSAAAGMPYLASLGKTYGRTTNYHANTHPSLPNSLALAGASTYGVRDDKGPAYHPIPGRSVFDQAIAFGKPAKVYAESMPAPCYRSNYGRYAVRHNPWVYYADAGPRLNCKSHDVPLGTPSSGALHDDVVNGRVPYVSMVVPNVCNDAHDCSLATADSWLESWLTFVMRGADYRGGRLAVVVTFDEDDYSAGNLVLTTVVSPYTRGIVSGESYTHYSWTHYAEQLVGSAALNNAGTARSLRPAFHI